MSHPSLHTHIPECNSSMTHNQILCRSNHPHPSLTTTLSHCIITLLQEKPATLHQPQCTEYHNCTFHIIIKRFHTAHTILDVQGKVAGLLGLNLEHGTRS